MLKINNTPHYAGVTVAGDYQDLDELYEALHLIVGEEGELPSYDSVRLRVLGVCYDIRHSLMGGRGAIVVPNGFDRERARSMPIIGPETNIYLTFEVMWPELLFVSFSLNDFIQLYEKRTNTHPWDPTIIAVRKFQGAVVRCLQETLSESKFGHIKKYIRPWMNYSYGLYNNYPTQYVDQLNIKFLKMKPEKRLTNISIMAKRLGQLDHNYMEAREAIRNAAAELNVHESEIRFKEEYPEDFEW
ncbi:hypothetical protein [uncultured Planococcus sp.]|uniref:DUF6904 family protein n=1 Tax=uncultured Planococcus sp. TaxID=337815 RepID=UPI00262C6D24|nr:hypothetical protein [uncultured Planococcus sp.]